MQFREEIIHPCGYHCHEPSKSGGICSAIDNKWTLYGMYQIYFLILGRNRFRKYSNTEVYLQVNSGDGRNRIESIISLIVCMNSEYVAPFLNKTLYVST